MNADGTNVRQLTSNADFDSAPSWSPDGKRILFERAPAGTFTPGTEAQEKDIYVMRADGTHVRRLTDSPGLDEGPEFSPDGTKIAFSSARDGQQEIYVMDADGSNPRQADRQPRARRVARLAGAALRRHRPPGVRRRLARLRRRVERARDAGPVPRRAPDRATLERGRRRGCAARQAPWTVLLHDAAALRPDRGGLHARARRRAPATSRSCGATRRGRPRRRRPRPRRSPLRRRTRRPRTTRATRAPPRPTRRSPHPDTG